LLFQCSVSSEIDAVFVNVPRITRVIPAQIVSGDIRTGPPDNKADASNVRSIFAIFFADLANLPLDTKKTLLSFEQMFNHVRICVSFAPGTFIYAAVSGVQANRVRLVQ
jgi:hypothetical protein